MNVWRRGSLLHNPYLRNAFRVARVPRETTQRRTVVQVIAQTKRVVSTSGQAHAIAGVPVSSAELISAATILERGPERIAEELLHHSTERASHARLRALADEAGRALAGDGEDFWSPTALPCLRPWLKELAGRYLDQVPGLDPSFGAQELALISPLGHPEEE
jgi:hypothetical protein